MSTPIIFFHLGNPEFLGHSLNQARCKNSRIILLGDETNQGYDFVEHYMFNDYLDTQAKDFIDVYDHLSTNNRQFELVCFLRWFAIKNFVKKIFY